MPPLPGRGTFRAALRWLAQLRTTDVPKARVLFTHHPRYADLTPAQYAEGLAWLRQTGFLNVSDRPMTTDTAEALRKLVTAADVYRPGWAAPRHDTDVEEGTDELWCAAGRAFGFSADEVTEALRGSSGKVDTAERERIGALAERALAELLRRIHGVRVCHVAEQSDGYGYDIEVKGVAEGSLHIEVKATTNPHHLVVYLTRHEYETMRRDPHWAMAAVLIGPHDELSAVATVDREWLSSSTPRDRVDAGRWESVRLHVPRQAIVPGITGLGLRVRGDKQSGANFQVTAVSAS